MRTVRFWTANHFSCHYFSAARLPLGCCDAEFSASDICDPGVCALPLSYCRPLPRDHHDEILSATCCSLCQRWPATWLRAERPFPCHFRATHCSRSNATWRTCRGGSGCRFRRTLEITRVVSSCQTMRGQLQCPPCGSAPADAKSAFRAAKGAADQGISGPVNWDRSIQSG